MMTDKTQLIAQITACADELHFDVDLQKLNQLSPDALAVIASDITDLVNAQRVYHYIQEEHHA